MLTRSGLALQLAVMALVLGAPGALTMPAHADTPATTLPAKDTRAAETRTVDAPRTFPAFATRAEWETRRAFIRQQILVSCGLTPMPPRTPLKARIFDRMQRDGYTIEKVYLQTYPGFYLAGNLYRPFKSDASKSDAPKSESASFLNHSAKPPYPGVLIAHGHWQQGRLADTPDGSNPARAITFARQGYVAFTYDMVGYNDTRQIDHKFANDRQHWLWGISLMGLQTWNSLRALDFLASLPDVDTARLAITGESGGGTQTMMLGALDDRLAAVGPCVMVSHTMQGGCLCENAPGLRVEFSNMELAACAAPRIQMMVGATGDWTKTMMTVEGPAVASIYQLYNAPDRLKYAVFDYGHNINKTSREAFYDFFGRWLLNQKDASRLKEPPYQREPLEALRVFPNDTPLPSDALTADALTHALMTQAKADIDQRKPTDRATLLAFQKTFTPAWEHTLALQTPTREQLRVVAQTPESVEGGSLTRLNFGREGRGDNVPAVLYLPAGKPVFDAVVIVHPQGKAALMKEATGKPGPLVAALLAKGRAALLLDAFLTGERANPQAQAARKPFEKFFTTYNRTDLQERVQDILTACAYLRSRDDARTITLAGVGRAGPWTLLAAPAGDAAVVDCDQLDLTTDDALLADDLFTPCLRRLGDFRTTAALAAPHPLCLHNTGAKFAASSWIAEVYRSLGVAKAMQVTDQRLDDNALVEWITSPHDSRESRENRQKR